MGRVARSVIPKRWASTLARHLGWLVIVCLLAGQADAFLINNGGAPPNPDNVLNTDVSSGAFIHRVRNAGCGTPVDETANCPVPGAPTTYRVDPGGNLRFAYVTDSSILEVAGGQAIGAYAYGRSQLTVHAGQVDLVHSYGNSRVEVLGGTVVEGLSALQDGHIDWRGGTVGDYLRARDEGSRIVVYGSGFAIDGIPVSFGDIALQTGVLTGTLANGDAIDVLFAHAGGVIFDSAQNGLITLVPEPGTAALLSLGLLQIARRRPSRRGLDRAGRRRAA